MARLLFEKTGKSVWISHLDLMRLFQRAFKRAGLPLTHTQGFNPRPSVSIALPLSVGVESECELLDFNLDGEAVPMEQIVDKLNLTLVEGVRVREAYEKGSKLRDLAFMNCHVFLNYDSGVPDGAFKAITNLFNSESLMVEKKSKNGYVEQDIIPMIRSLSVFRENEKVVVIDAVIACQNPSMNPVQLSQAVERYLPDLKPDHVCCRRIEIFDHALNVFR